MVAVFTFNSVSDPALLANDVQAIQGRCKSSSNTCAFAAVSVCMSPFIQQIRRYTSDYVSVYSRADLLKHTAERKTKLQVEAEFHPTSRQLDRSQLSH